MKNKNSNNEDNNKFANNYVKYSSLAIQMALIILIGTFGGSKLDDLLKLSFPVFTVSFSLLSVFAAIYLLIKEIN